MKISFSYDEKTAKALFQRAVSLKTVKNTEGDERAFLRNCYILSSVGKLHKFMREGILDQAQTDFLTKRIFEKSNSLFA